MDKDSLRAFCLALPGTTEEVQWGNDLLYKVGGKMYLVTNLEPAEITGISLKCSPEVFAEIIEREGIKPSKYLARYHWVHVSDLAALKAKELQGLIRDSYTMVREKLPKKVKAALEGS